MVDYSVPASPQVTRERVYKQRGQQEGQGLMGPEASKASSAGSLGPVFPGFSENVPYLAAEVSAISQISECFRLKDKPFTVLAGYQVLSNPHPPPSLLPRIPNSPGNQKLPQEPKYCAACPSGDSTVSEYSMVIITTTSKTYGPL